MAIVKFYLEKRNDKEGILIEKNVPINLFFSFNNKRLVYYTQERVDSCNYNIEYWKDSKKKVIKKDSPQAANKNANLDTLKLLVETIYSQGKALGVDLTKEYFKSILDAKFKSKTAEPKVKKILFGEALEEYLATTKEYLASGTYKKVSTTKNHLVEFLGEANYKKLDFSEVDNDFIGKFRGFLVKRVIRKDNVSKEETFSKNNTVVKYMLCLRTFLNWCKDIKKYFVGDIKINDRANDIDVIYLSLKEVEMLVDATMPNAKLQRVKDVFLFGCNTGMRYMDMKKLRKDDIKDRIASFYITKSHNTVKHILPLSNLALDIFEKYNNVGGELALPSPSNQKMNNYIKQVVEIAGINEILSIKRKMGNGKDFIEQFKKFELITCHSSRKTFVSSAIKNGMAESMVKQLTGHSKKSRAFHAYVGTSIQDKIEAIEKAFGK